MLETGTTNTTLKLLHLEMYCLYMHIELDVEELETEWTGTSVSKVLEWNVS